MRLTNPWLTLIGERFLTPEPKTVDYWRVEKADSVIVLPLWRGRVILPPAQYRPGIGEVSLDLPGGRVEPHQTPNIAAEAILQRELGMPGVAIDSLTPINLTAWPVNSSFSNQRLFGLRATLKADFELDLPTGSRTLPYTDDGLRDLLEQIACLQCRVILLETLLDLKRGPQAQEQ